MSAHLHNLQSPILANLRDIVVKRRWTPLLGALVGSRVRAFLGLELLKSCDFPVVK